MRKTHSLRSAVGKRVGQTVYVHRSAVDYLQASTKEKLNLALQRVPTDFQWSVLKVSEKDEETFSFLDYQDFSIAAFPELRASLRVNLSEAGTKLRSYSDVNPPILHRKELLLSPDDPSRDDYVKLTQFLERQGLFKDMASKGTRRVWFKALAEAGFAVEGSRIVRRSVSLDELPEVSTSAKKKTVERHRTAIARAALSAPMYLLFTSGLIREDVTIL
ncbi:MAG: hypothetical protein AAF709_18645, partial [Pseudomonadota bacterium]